MGWEKDLQKRLREIGWLVLAALLRWGLERLVGNPGPAGDLDAESE